LQIITEALGGAAVGVGLIGHQRLLTITNVARERKDRHGRGPAVG
jgi:hypothetical protein